MEFEELRRMMRTESLSHLLPFAREFFPRFSIYWQAVVEWPNRLNGKRNHTFNESNQENQDSRSEIESIMNTLVTPFSLFLAAGNLQQNLGQVAGVLHAIALVLFFGGLIMAAIMFMMGRTEYLKYGLVGSGIGGLAWVIVSTFWSAGSGVDPGIQLQNF
jgi:hypothetical protein